MANCNSEFQAYNSNLNLTQSKHDKMNNSREATRRKIKKNFKENHPEYKPTFWIQGSKKHGTNIRNEDDSCDQDDGIYFDKSLEDSVSGATLQKWVYEAIKDDTTEGATWKKKCIRKKYKENNLGTYHFDYPIYLKTDDMPHPKLAVKKGEFEESDPKEFSVWLGEQKDDGGQLIRIIKYLKGWCSYKGKKHKMPSGLSMTVLASMHVVFKEKRDDECLFKTLKAIRKELKKKWECKMPTTPCDNLFAQYDNSFKDRFFGDLDKFIEDANLALKESSKHKATKLWKKHLGSRFPVVEKEQEEQKLSVESQLALASLVGNNKPYFDG